MKPSRSILDRSFEYVPAVSTSVADTWRRFGWRPITAHERDRRPKVVGRAPGWGMLTVVPANADGINTGT